MKGQRLRVKAKIIREIFSGDNGYKILGCKPLESVNGLVVHPVYRNFTLVGECPFLNEGDIETLDIEEMGKDKYGIKYNLINVPSMKIDELTDDNEYSYLCKITTPSQARYIHNAYPNYIRLILNDKIEEIDVSKIYNVKEVRHKIYVREILDRYKYLQIICCLPQYKFTLQETRDLGSSYTTIDEVREALDTNPYKVLYEVLKRPFKRVDSLLLGLNPALKESPQRKEYCIIAFLKEYEARTGSTRVLGNEIAINLRQEYPECLKDMKEICKNSSGIYYNEATKEIALMASYVAECEVSLFIKERLKTSVDLNLPYQEYMEFDNIKLTEEQGELLKNASKYKISVLAGYSGCVDKDTEYFNGTEWKPINEYSYGEQVLQYEEDGKAKLVQPLRYVKLPCEKMYHFETKYGINQTLSEDHIISYITSKGNLAHKPFLDFKKMHEATKCGFTGKFITTFDYENGDKGIDLTDAQIRLMVAVIADGHFPKRANGFTDVCRFNLKKDRKKKRIVKLIEDCGLEYRERESTVEGYINIYVKAPRVEKEFTAYWYGCNRHQREIIADEVLRWDGNVKGKRRNFSSNSKKSVDFIQFVFSSLGIRATISTEDRTGREYFTCGKIYTRKSIEHSVILSSKSPLVGLTNYGGEKLKIEEVASLDGYKYCFTVPSGMLVLRRKGRIFITHNCGKSSAVKGLIEMLKDNEYTYTLLAPTGKASKRLSQTTGENCCTIHKACFSELGIGTDFVIIDECSMISLELMKMLIDAISSEKTRVVLIGDNAQLSPIGAGNVFQDIIMSQEVPIAKLTKIFRYSDGGVIKVATDIRTGKSFFESEEPVQHYGNNFTFKQTEVEVAFDNIIDEYMLALKKHAPEDIMIISPQNVGSIGTYIINNKIQSIVNPMKPNQEALSRKIDNIQVVFREGDYVINKKNNYEAMDEKTYLINKKNRKTDLTDEEINILEERENNKNKNAVFNGESGRVIKVTKDYLVVDFFDQREIVFDKAGISNLLLSYCQTCHSVQGSQAKHVINITLPCHKKMLSRNLLYVAETRSEGTVVELGDMQTIEEAIKIAENERRNTFLEGLLREE